MLGGKKGEKEFLQVYRYSRVSGTCGGHPTPGRGEPGGGRRAVKFFLSGRDVIRGAGGPL